MKKIQLTLHEWYDALKPPSPYRNKKKYYRKRNDKCQKQQNNDEDNDNNNNSINILAIRVS